MLPTEIPTTTPVDLYTIVSGQTATDGHIACLDAAGKCRNAADAAGLKVAGLFLASRPTDGVAEIREGVFRLANSDSDGFAREDRGKVAYVEDSETVASVPGTHAVVAGLVVDVDADGVFVDTRAAARAAAQALHDTGADSLSAAIEDPASQTQSTLTLTAMTGTANTAPAAEINTTELTDNGGGTADGTVAAQAAPVTLTDETGKSGTHDDTLAAATAPTAPVITYSSNNPSITPDAAVTIADGSAPSVGELLEFCEELKKCVADTATAVGVLLQNDSDNGQKAIELVTLAGVAQNNLKEVTTELAKQRALNIVLINDAKTFATQLNAAKADIATLTATVKALRDALVEQRIIEDHSA